MRARMVFHIVTLGLTGLMVYTAVPGSDLFSWHPTLMAVAFCLLMAQAIAIFSPESSLLQVRSRPGPPPPQPTHTPRR